MNNSDMPAMPLAINNGDGSTTYKFGLSKREHFAAMAMQGFCTNGTDNICLDYYSQMAVKHADALLAALEEQP